jgi:hypothetical protein
MLILSSALGGAAAPLPARCWTFNCVIYGPGPAPNAMRGATRVAGQNPRRVHYAIVTFSQFCGQHATLIVATCGKSHHKRRRDATVFSWNIKWNG